MCKLDKTMPVLLHQIAAAATFIPPPDLFNQNRLGPTGRATCQAYASPGPLQSEPIRSHWQSTVSGCLQCIKSSIAIPRMYLPKRQTKSFVNNPPIKLYSAYQYLVKLNRQRTCKPNSLFQTKYVSAKPNFT